MESLPVPPEMVFLVVAPASVMLSLPAPASASSSSSASVIVSLPSKPATLDVTEPGAFRMSLPVVPVRLSLPLRRKSGR